MILDIYKDSLEYSLQDGKTLLKLGLTLLFSFLIIPIFFVLGYYYRVLDTSTHGMINGDEKLPDFSDLLQGNMYAALKKVSVLAVHSRHFIPFSVVLYMIVSNHPWENPLDVS